MESKEWGQAPCAFLVSETPIAESELIEFCRNRLAGYKVPHQFYFVDSLPRNASNKLMRKNLKALIQKEKKDED